MNRNCYVNLLVASFVLALFAKTGCYAEETETNRIDAEHFRLTIDGSTLVNEDKGAELSKAEGGIEVKLTFHNGWLDCRATFKSLEPKLKKAHGTVRVFVAASKEDGALVACDKKTLIPQYLLGRGFRASWLDIPKSEIDEIDRLSFCVYIQYDAGGPDSSLSGREALADGEHADAEAE